MTIQIKATEQYFPVVLFTMLYKVVLTFESVDEILILIKATEQYFILVLFPFICCKRKVGISSRLDHVQLTITTVASLLEWF